MRNRDTTTRRVWMAVLLALAMFAAACGGDDDDEGGSASASEPAAEDGSGTAGDDEGAAGAVEGCDDGASTDPSDQSAEREVARCEPGAPAAQPLDERATIRMSSSFKAEFVAPVLLADHFGEFDAENLDFEFVELGFSDALTQIASGDIDCAIGGTEAAFFNAIERGIDVRWTIGNFFPPDAGDESTPQTGLWARSDAFSDPENPDVAELEGTNLASAVGLGSVIAYPIALAFDEAGVSLLDMKVEQIPSPDMVQALENGAVQSAWLLDPFWIEASESGDLVLLATQPAGEPLGGLYCGGHMFEDDRDKALAFFRAIIRTINTHLDGDYQADAEVMEALAEQTGTSVESLEATPALVFDWEIREGTTDRIQEFFIEFDTVDHDEPIAEDTAVDRSLYLEVVGAD